jgi:uncharacterized phage infection (PIP) family protein YhgE
MPYCTPKPAVTIRIRRLYIDLGRRPFQSRQLDTIVEALSTILTRLQTMSEQFNEAVASLQEEIGETRTEVSRLATLIADLIAQINAANDAGDTAAVRAATAELDIVNAGLQALAPAPPVETDPSV